MKKNIFCNFDNFKIVFILLTKIILVYIQVFITKIKKINFKK